jgi:exodeoxyribonuclease VII small subunit
MSDATSKSDAASGNAISYEAARDELLEVVRQLEAGGLPLEKSLTLWERGEQLAVICQSWLDGAKDRLAARRPSPDSATNATDEGENDSE